MITRSFRSTVLRKERVIRVGDQEATLVDTSLTTEG